MNKIKKIISMSLILILILSSIGCGKSKKTSEKKEITVFAAASLTESMEEIVQKFKEKNPEFKVNVHLAGSSKLRVQIEQGVNADIFISANSKHYDVLKEKGFISVGEHFLNNSMVVIVPKENKKKINKIEDLQKKCKLVIAQKEVPAGNYARKIINSLNGAFGEKYEDNVLKNIVSEESNIKQVVNKVVLGEADAAFVYKSDVTAKVKEKVNVIDIPSKYNVKATYWIAKLKQSENKGEVDSFYEFLLQKESKEIFEKYGFDNNEET